MFRKEKHTFSTFFFYQKRRKKEGKTVPNERAFFSEGDLLYECFALPNWPRDFWLRWARLNLFLKGLLRFRQKEKLFGHINAQILILILKNAVFILISKSNTFLSFWFCIFQDILKDYKKINVVVSMKF